MDSDTLHAVIFAERGLTRSFRFLATGSRSAVALEHRVLLKRPGAFFIPIDLFRHE